MDSSLFKFVMEELNSVVLECNGTEHAGGYVKILVDKTEKLIKTFDDYHKTNKLPSTPKQPVVNQQK